MNEPRYIWCDDVDRRLAALEAKIAEPRWDQAALDVLMWRVDQLETRLAEYEKTTSARTGPIPNARTGWKDQQNQVPKK